MTNIRGYHLNYKKLSLSGHLRSFVTIVVNDMRKEFMHYWEYISLVLILRDLRTYFVHYIRIMSICSSSCHSIRLVGIDSWLPEL